MVDKGKIAGVRLPFMPGWVESMGASTALVRLDWLNPLLPSVLFTSWP